MSSDIEAPCPNNTGKEHAKRWTMMDAFFMMMPGDRERIRQYAAISLLDALRHRLRD